MSHLLSRLADVLKDGLNSRARALSICPNHQSEISTATVQIGLYLEPGQIQRLVEYGPAADIPEEVKKFRQLWGNKAETRKFRDGRILESVVWEAEGPEQRSKIFMQIIQHLLSHHFSLPKTSVHFFAPAYDKLLAESPQVRNARYSADPQITGFSPLTAAFDYLVKELKELKDLPLQITSVVPVSEDLRYSSTFVPGALRVKNLPHLSTAANHVTVHDCYITFETSGKWPEDLEAIQKIKGAFLARLAKTLSQAIPGTRCTVQYDLDSDPVTDHCCLIVTVPQGFVFRLRVHHERERSMMEDALLDDDQDETHKKRTQAALVRHHKTFTALPDHHGALSALQSKHPSYSTTVRITKRWLAAHCLANHLPTELIELVAAHVYLDAESPYEVPATGAMGFARVLDFLSQWKWRESPLLVPIYTAPTVHDVGIVTSFPDKQRQKAMSNFAALRKADPMLTRSAWFIATEKDTGGRAWGEQSPSKLVAGRVQELARACSQVLSSAMTSGNPNVQVCICGRARCGPDADLIDFQHIFISDLDAFDFVLHLSPAMVSNHMQAVVPSSKDLAKRPDTPQTIRPGFNAAVSYLNRLEVSQQCILYNGYVTDLSCSLCRVIFASSSMIAMAESQSAACSILHS